MKLLLSILLFLNFSTNLDITDIRKMYPSVVLSEKNAKEFASKLSEITKEDNKTLVAYKGASIIIEARFKKELAEKTKSLKEGSKLLEFAIAAEPNRTEIHLIRLSIQENLPKIVNYRANIKEDKSFVLEHYKEESTVLKDYIKNFILQSKSFSEIEKQKVK